MAKRPIPKHKRKVSKKKAFAQEIELPQRVNYIILLVGVAVILIGYVVMALGSDISPLSVTVAPIILVIGYCLIIPVGILYRRKQAIPTPQE
ncbi:MAG: DUF3098 domain-containing protein [Bacteroidota bacterium]|nr:DUF3098 domain-containing protein [Bacteroidota bacterium]